MQVRKSKGRGGRLGAGKKKPPEELLWEERMKDLRDQDPDYVESDETGFPVSKIGARYELNADDILEWEVTQYNPGGPFSLGFNFYTWGEAWDTILERDFKTAAAAAREARMATPYILKAFRDNAKRNDGRADPESLAEEIGEALNIAGHCCDDDCRSYGCKIGRTGHA